MRPHGVFDRGQFLHQFFIDVEPARGIDQQHVAEFLLRFLQRALANHHRRDLRIGIVDGKLQFSAEDFQLVDGGGSVHVGRNQIGRALLVSLQIAGEFRQGSCFAGALQTDQHDHHGRSGLEIDVLVFAAEKPNHLITDDFDKLLLGRKALQNLLAHRLGFDGFEKSLNDLDVDIGFQEREANIAQRIIDVLLGDLALTPKPLKGQLEFFA